MEIKTILIPVDGSEPAENAFRYGVGLAEENGATIVLLHVLDANETYYATNRVMLAGGMLDERKETAQRVMDQMKSQVPEGITCKTVIAAGVPGETACRTAKEENADLIVVGNSGKGRHFLLRYGKRQPLHHSSCTLPCPCHQINRISKDRFCGLFLFLPPCFFLLYFIEIPMHHYKNKQFYFLISICCN